VKVQCSDESNSSRDEDDERSSRKRMIALLYRTSIEDDDYHNQLAGKADAGDGLRVFLVCSK
jgi:hypothetical protein